MLRLHSQMSGILPNSSHPLQRVKRLYPLIIDLQHIALQVQLRHLWQRRRESSGFRHSRLEPRVPHYCKESQLRDRHQGQHHHHHLHQTSPYKLSQLQKLVQGRQRWISRLGFPGPTSYNCCGRGPGCDDTLLLWPLPPLGLRSITIT